MMEFGFSFWIFTFSLLTILYTYFGFPLLIALRAFLRPKSYRSEAITPKVSLIIIVHNEAPVIRNKLENVFSLEYPRDSLEIIVGSDGSTDETNEIVSQYPEVQLIACPRQGKNRTLNAAVAAATGEILVFSDADSMLVPHALLQLVAPFADPAVGGVGGDYRYAEDVFQGEGERSYWSYDRWLKRLQTLSGSMTSATGQIYAIRHSLFRPVPQGVTDDFYTSVQAAYARQRLVFQPRAIAHGPVADSVEAEFRRKVRLITRGLWSVWEMRALLNPFRYGFYAVQLLTHKVLRRIVFLPFLTLGASAITLQRQSLFFTLVASSFLFLLLLGGLGLLLRKKRIGHIKPLALASFFLMVNTTAALAFFNLVRGFRYETWEPQRSSNAPSNTVEWTSVKT